MSDLTILCAVDDVKEDAPLSVSAENFPALAVYEYDGEYFVTDNTCTHGMAMLTDGYQDGAVIECPFHGGAFCIKTGEATAAPCFKPIKSYPVTVVNSNICISAAS